MRHVDWDIRREGRAWDDEAEDRWQLTPEKFEMYEGRLFFDNEERILLLGLLRNESMYSSSASAA